MRLAAREKLHLHMPALDMFLRPPERTSAMLSLAPSLQPVRQGSRGRALSG
jgi:hypothetical protein